MWITVKSKRELLDEDLILRELSSGYAEFEWTDELIRTEDIQRVYALDKKLLVVEFYHRQDKMIIKESIQEFHERIIPLDYEMSFTLEEEPEQENT